VHLHPLVATVELRPAARYSTDELLRALHEGRLRAGRSDEGVLFLDATEAEEALARVRDHDERLGWVTEALAHGRIEVHFQPVVDLKSGRLADVEALARIRTPRGLLAAGEFIDDVHRLGETATLDGHVMRRVGECAGELARATPRLFVNVSPLSLGSAGFRAVMASTIARLREEGLRLVMVLELTEQALLEHDETIREIHRTHGVTFAVDDFGTGYSSLRTVSDLAVSRVVSVLKIDGSLIRHIADSTEAFKVVLAVAHLAKSLDLRVIAEHVETAEVLERLRTTGIECAQGFLFDPALPVDELLLRYAGEGRVLADPPPRPHLLLLQPYLHRAFEAFYERLLSDPHFARYFRDEAQVLGLVERQKQTFLESLGDDNAALRLRYTGLGRRHAEIGLPLATFLKGADILHEELLEVLVHATREASVFRDTQRFFVSLRGFMARGYLEKALPEARAELARLRQGAAGASLGPRAREAVFACVDGLLAGIEGHLQAPETPPGRPLALVGAGACPATPWLEAGGAGKRSHEGLHGDAESLAYFLSQAEYAAVAPILEGLQGRFHLLLLAS
jgi:EAL domain-containing protein (putative c-di-GMP-specific phosphodiesterase class I)